MLLQGFLALRGFTLDDIDGMAVSSGVPRVKESLRLLADRYLEFDPVMIEPGVRTGIAILAENPKEVGADRIANAVAAYDLFGGPTIIADFGTATTCDAVSANGEYLGGAIAPGIGISMDALVGRAAALRAVELVEPRSVLGKSTVECIQSGAVYGFAAQVDGLCERIQDELGDVHHRLDRRAGRAHHAAVEVHRALRALAHPLRPPPRLREERLRLRGCATKAGNSGVIPSPVPGAGAGHRRAAHAPLRRLRDRARGPPACTVRGLARGVSPWHAAPPWLRDRARAVGGRFTGAANIREVTSFPA